MIADGTISQSTPSPLSKGRNALLDAPTRPPSAAYPPPSLGKGAERSETGGGEAGNRSDLILLRHVLKLIAVCAALFYSAASLSAQTDTVEIDSTEALDPDVIIVTAQRLIPRIAEGTHPTAIITRERIGESGARDLADAVAFAPGVFVKRYGGLGGLRTVSLRGTAPQQTTLMINGVRYRSSAESGFDFGNIPAEALHSVEVVRGGDAVLFGANSVGGGINVVTGVRSTDGLRLRTTLAGGSFGERSIGLGATGGSERDETTVVWDGSLHRTESQGDYPFTFNEFGVTQTISRANGDFTNTFARAAVSLRLNSGWRFGATAQGYDTERGVPGAVVQGNRERLRARLDEQDLFLVGQAERSLAEWNLSFAASGRTNILRYRDPDARLTGRDGIDNRFDRTEGSAIGTAMWIPDDVTLVRTILELEYAGLTGDNLDPSAGEGVTRMRYGAATGGSRTFREGFFGKELKLEAGARLDLFSDIDPQFAPSLGFVWRPFVEPLRLRMHSALNYRTPSFSEQYYLNFGNTNLRAERSRSVSAGLTWEATPSVAIESGVFAIDTRDQIVAIPRSPVSWSAQNVGHVLSRGIEFAIVGSFFDGLLSGQTSYTRMRAEDRTDGVTNGHLIPYAPEELFNGILALRRWGIGLSGSWEYVSYRHTLAYNTPESALPHYLIVNAGLSATRTLGAFELTGRIEAANIFDEEYQVVRNYPMPGRSLRFELSVGYRSP